MKEHWKPIGGLEDRYDVSSFGAVRSLLDGDHAPLTPIVRQGGRVEICVYHEDGKREFRGLARLVLEAFSGPCPDGHVALHYDGDSTNNKLGNIRWATLEERERWKYRNGTALAQATHCRKGLHLFDSWNTYWTPAATRVCRACVRDRKRSQIDSND